MNLAWFYKKLLFLRNNIIFTPRTLTESNNRNADVKYLALVGLPRTGTSIFLNVLNNNDDFFLLYESMLSPFLAFKNRTIINSYFSEFLKQSIHQNKNLNKKHSYVQEYKFFGDKIIYDSSKIINFLLKKALKKRIDKTIFIVRDPRATYLSYKKWIQKRNEIYPNTKKVYETGLTKQMKKWSNYIEFINKYKNSENKVLIVRYEDLAINEVKELARINNFLDYEPTVQNNLLMNDSSIDSWKNGLDTKEIEAINKLTQTGRSLFNYQ